MSSETTSNPPGSADSTARRSWQFALAVTIGAFIIVAGFLRMGEILFEWVVVSVILFHPAVVNPNFELAKWRTGVAPLDWLLALAQGKFFKLRDAIFSASPGKPIFSVLLTGIALGWGGTLGWLFWRDWRFVFSPELIETALDLALFGVAFFLVRDYYRAQYHAHEAARKKTLPKRPRSARSRMRF